MDRSMVGLSPWSWRVGHSWRDLTPSMHKTDHNDAFLIDWELVFLKIILLWNICIFHPKWQTVFKHWCRSPDMILASLELIFYWRKLESQVAHNLFSCSDKCYDENRVMLCRVPEERGVAYRNLRTEDLRMRETHLWNLQRECLRQSEDKV